MVSTYSFGRLHIPTSKDASSSSTKVLPPCGLGVATGKPGWPGPPGPPTGCAPGACCPENIPLMDDAILIQCFQANESAHAQGDHEEDSVVFNLKK